MEATWMQAQDADTAAWAVARDAGEAVEAQRQAEAATFQNEQPAGGGSQDVLAGQ